MRAYYYIKKTALQRVLIMSDNNQKKTATKNKSKRCIDLSLF